jgi:hypothetical protein
MESFSSRVKQELSEINIWKNSNEIIAELYGYLLTSSDNKFVTENDYNINRFAKILKNLDYNNFSIQISGKNYIIEIKSFKKFKEIYGIQKFNEILNKSDESIIKALVRGAFLGRGSINNPKNGYHLDMIFDNVEYANVIKNELLKYNIDMKLLVDKNFVLYLKDGESISDFLAFIGAAKSVLNFEDERIVKEIRNNVNRLVNCETANLQKTINSSVEQIENIKLIKEKKKFNSLSEAEQSIAELRLKNPEASFKVLGEMLKPAIGKTAVSYRFNNIKKLADELR